MHIKYTITLKKHLSILLLFLILSIFTVSCASVPTSHSFSYDFEDNPQVSLLTWEYSGGRVGFTGEHTGLGNFSHGFSSVGDEMKIKWLDKSSNKVFYASLPIKKNMPFDSNYSEIRLTFDESNSPEIYAFYRSPSAHKYFKFKNRIYVDKRVRKIFPTVEEMKINP
ncbi:hypothetical protein [Ottowia thiooxydans]|uniref:Lipoprotein n=1 Tax=Ottowia thiooxydans TaxID=219182 RepID=A0ABV2Q8E7_9BURK